jgi:phosphoglucosamine mutase
MDPVWVDSANLGKSRRLDDAAGRYIEFCKSTFANNLTLKGLRIVVDAAHGAAYNIAPKVFHELGAEVISIGCAPDGLNINRGVGATHPEALVEAVKAHRADMGVALDGDADRLQIVDAHGRLFNGDELLYLMVDDRLRRGEPVPGVVGTLMTNMAVELALTARGVVFVRAKVGDRYVLEELEKNQWLLGGEGSGHLLALDKHSTGDGLISALQVLQTVVRSGQSLATLLRDVVLFPQTMINVRLQPGQDWKASPQLAPETRAVEAELGQSGRVLIRASGTEPLVRVMVEARDAAQAKSCAQRIVKTITV